MIIANLQSLTPNTLIELFEVSEFNLNNLTETFRFCNYSGVSYRLSPTATPFEYAAIECESEGFEVIGQGPIPQPKITLSNLGRVVTDLMFRMKYDSTCRLEGSKVTRRLTQQQFLEVGEFPLAPARELPVSEWLIEQLEEESNRAVRFLLSSPFDVENATLPNRPALRSCPFRYRDPNTCMYTGTAMFDRRNLPTGDPQMDVCNKTVDACELRFTGTLIRHGGYPGLGGF